MPRVFPMLLMEFIGTFFLVLIIGFAVTVGDSSIGILSVGLFFAPPVKIEINAGLAAFSIAHKYRPCVTHPKIINGLHNQIDVWPTFLFCDGKIFFAHQHVDRFVFGN